MLVLQRKAGESIVIGDDIEIAIVSVGATSVKIAIQAPKELVILRNELVETVDANKSAAAKDVNVEYLKNFIVANRKKGQETQYKKSLDKKRRQQKLIEKQQSCFTEENQK